MQVAPSTLLMIFEAALLTVSGIIWWGACWRLGMGEPILPRRFRSQQCHVSAWATGLVVLWLVWRIFEVLAQSLLPTQELSFEFLRTAVQIQNWISLGLILILTSAIVLNARQNTELIRLGFRTDHLGRQLGYGVWGFVAASLPCLLLMLPFSGEGSEDSSQLVLRVLQEHGFSRETAPLLIAAAVVAPIWEELVFRVVLQSTLQTLVRPNVAICLTALMFVAVHPYPASIGLLPLAFVLGYVYERRRSYLACVTIHALFNTHTLVSLYVNLQQTPPVGTS